MNPKESIHARLEIDWYEPLDMQSSAKIGGLAPEEQLKVVLPRVLNSRRLCTVTDEVTVTARDKWVLRVSPKEIAGSSPGP